ncbi:hypothetical protein RHGRI_009338 [Rhododendron griersonianum]|uniref:Nucleolar complex protein 3 homolog n=1 Tax=Rhododendron griersonianum TaxID=479676 RepID=A0AAV6KEC6_9ERIC|nr:hypothetical protein RHGRI_009338 [Rhododendron griersonianum]
MGRKQKIVLPPELPPEISDDEVEVSDEDLQFVNENRDYAGFVSNLDTHSITRHVSRVADVKEDALEALYERRSRKNSFEKEKEEKGLEVDRVDALPVKTLDGKLYYKTVPKTSKKSENETNGEDIGDNEADGADKSFFKLTKAEKRAKLKRARKEEKQQAKEVAKVEEVEQTPQAEVLAEVEKELTAEEANKRKKYKLAELGTALLMDPESNVKSLKEMLQISKDEDHSVAVLGLKSLLAVFKDIIPGYRIRLPTEKEQEMVVSKAVKKMRFYDSTLLSAYKAYLQRLIALKQKTSFQRVAIRCICTLLDAVPHFNYRESLLAAVIHNISSTDDVVRKLCCATVKSLFTNEGKHGGEATVEAVQLIAEYVKAHDCQLHPDSIEVLMSLSFDEDLGRAEMSSANNKVDADFKAATFAQDVRERKMMQSETLSAIFQTFFRILKHTMHTITARSEGISNSSAGASGGHPLLAPCLNGIGKFSHLIDLDFMGDLINHLRKLAGGGSNSDGSPEKFSRQLSVTERLRCCIVAFKVMKNNLDALNVDLQDFFVQLYSIMLEYRPGRDHGEVLAEALKIMLCDDRQHDMQRAAAFIKRLATFALCFGCAESMAGIFTNVQFILKLFDYSLLGVLCFTPSVSIGTLAALKYQPYASDPNLSGALASVLWELNLLSKHYHPDVSTLASSISTISSAQNQVYHSNVTPQQAFMQSSLEQELFNPKTDKEKANLKRKRGSGSSMPNSSLTNNDVSSTIDEDMVKKKLSEHFLLVHEISETMRLRRELDHATSSLKLYEQYKKQKETKKDGSKPRKMRRS